MTLARLLRDGHTHHPEKTALIFGEHTWTYAEIDILTDRLAANLLARAQLIYSQRIIALRLRPLQRVVRQRAASR